MQPDNCGTDLLRRKKACRQCKSEWLWRGILLRVDRVLLREGEMLRMMGDICQQAVDITGKKITIMLEISIILPRGPLSRLNTITRYFGLSHPFPNLHKPQLSKFMIINI